MRPRAALVYGSDWPVSTANPFHAMEVAVLRSDPAVEEGKQLLPQEAISVDDMLVALTKGGAQLMQQEAIRGSLEPGKLADLVLLDRDPYQLGPNEISEVAVELTVFDGRIVHRRD